MKRIKRLQPLIALVLALVASTAFGVNIPVKNPSGGTIGAASITDVAGTGAPNFSNGLQVNGQKTIAAVNFVTGPAGGSTNHTVATGIAIPSGAWMLWGSLTMASSTENQKGFVSAYGTGTTITLDRTYMISGTGTPAISNSGGNFLWTLTGAAGSPSAGAALFILFK